MSKFSGKSYDGYEVVGSYVNNTYNKQYGKETKLNEHRAYNYVLVNKETRDSKIISGNQLRKIDANKGEN